jgi:predicted AlkP superfamily pyrophosphatase or phosphodiesterase
VSARKLVLAVIDGLKPAELERAVQIGRAPVLARAMQRGTYVDACCAAFPSVTPVCAASITTGVRQDRHHIPAMNWYSRADARYVEYGSSFAATRRFGVARQLNDLIYRMNRDHLSADTPTVFETLDDADVRTAGTTYLFFRGRHQHKPSKDSTLSRLAATVIRKPVMGPRELFYADIFASRDTGCWSRLGMPGLRDQHAGCVGAYLVEHDLFDFLLFSLPDNDTHSHEHGPERQIDSIAGADRQLERLAHAAGGVDAFLDTHALIVMADHSHSLVEELIDLEGAIREHFAVLAPSLRGAKNAEIAVCPSQRSAQLYVLVEEARAELLPRLVEASLALDGVDLAIHRAPNGDAVIATVDRGVLRFRAATAATNEPVVDARGGRWSVAGDLGALGASVSDGRFDAPDYPDALARVWAALECPTSGDLLLSAAPGYEFPDWGGEGHVGGGSHGSLHAADSLGALIFSGVEAPAARADGAWTIADIAPMVRGHFSG